MLLHLIGVATDVNMHAGRVVDGCWVEGLPPNTHLIHEVQLEAGETLVLASSRKIDVIVTDPKGVKAFEDGVPCGSHEKFVDATSAEFVSERRSRYMVIIVNWSKKRSAEVRIRSVRL